jgi:hypothetical protein
MKYSSNDKQVKRTPPASRTGHALVHLTLPHLFENFFAAGGLGVGRIFYFVAGGLWHGGWPAFGENESPVPH